MRRVAAAAVGISSSAERAQVLGSKRAFVIDCDGVIYHGSTLLPGAKDFVQALQTSGKEHLFLTNASDKSAVGLVEKFNQLGLRTTPDHFYTSAMATAAFLGMQTPGGSAFVIGEECLKAELRREDLVVVNSEQAEKETPNFVIVGESNSKELYNFDEIERAVKLVRRGARFIGTNEDVADRIGDELQPGTGALTLPIEAATGIQAYYLGKPNPLMFRTALDRLGIDRSDAIVVGDRMNTDIRAGVEAGVETVLVLSGVTSLEDISKYGYRPTLILNGVGEIFETNLTS